MESNIFTNRCPVCRKEDKRSKYYNLSNSISIKKLEDYYDEEGIHHIHFYLPDIQLFRCSNGHEIMIKTIYRCCDEFPGMIETFIDGVKVKEESNE